ncbi:hypothetical protein VTO42DRAFT_4471 [Malbranchea cinnamomea]
MAAATASSNSPLPQPDDSSFNSDMISSQTHSQPLRRTSTQRPLSYAKNRMSTYSSTSQQRSRPASNASPNFPSSLPYTLVRDFAYPPNHPLHYGPPPKDSAVSSPVSESRRLSDPPSSTWNPSHSSWPAPHWNPEAMYSQQQLPAVSFGDGPPYSEDEDLHSPVVTTSRRRKHKSGQHGRGRSPGPRHVEGQEGDGALLAGGNNGSEAHYLGDGQGYGDGTVDQYMTYGSYGYDDPNSVPFDPGFEFDSDDEIDDSWRDNPSRYSRDYQFTIVSPDEEMHGKAVALFDFEREHENELPLKEGQIILVSYRHGQGWLVAEDPRTGESGLVPEEFVRLVRDIEGGLHSLNGDSSMDDDDAPGPDVEATPADMGQSNSGQSTNGEDIRLDAINDESKLEYSTVPSEPTKSETPGSQDPEKELNKFKGKAVVSTFSTSSRDFDPYPQHLLSGHQHSRSTPPQIEHYGNHSAQTRSHSSSRSRSVSKQSPLSDHRDNAEA